MNRLLALAFAADPANGVSEIRVAQGTYKPDDRPDPSSTFQLLNGVAIRGGYAGAAAPNPDERDLRAYQTVLSGDLAGNDDPDAFPAGPTFADNFHHVVTAAGIDSSALIDGFVIAGGRAAGGSGGGLVIDAGSPTVANCAFRNNWADAGGGVAIFNGAPVFSNCMFERNIVSQKGGAVFSRSSAAHFSGCVFSDGRAWDKGGALYAEGSTDVLENCQFSAEYSDEWELSAIYGGAIYNDGSSPVLTGCSFLGLRADLQGGAIVNFKGSNPILTGCAFTGNRLGTPFGSSTDLRGGAICNILGSGATIVGCSFTDNVAVNAKHGFGYGHGGAIFSDWDCDLAIIGCAFTGNTASDAGGAVANRGPAAIIQCSFAGNRSLYYYGGAVMQIWGQYLLAASSFAGNSARWAGGLFDYETAGSFVGHCAFVGNASQQSVAAMACWDGGTRIVEGCIFNGNSAPGSAGGLAVWSSNEAPGAAVTATNCTFTANVAGFDGGGAFVGLPYPEAGPFGSAAFRNCIFWGNTDASGNGETAQISIDDTLLDQCAVEYCDIEGLSQYAGSPGNIGLDPLFADADLRLGPGSPCIDAGWNNAVAFDAADRDGDGDTGELVPIDLDGSPRFADDPGTPDTGCGAPAVVDLGAYEYQGKPATVAFGDVGPSDQALLLSRLLDYVPLK